MADLSAVRDTDKRRRFRSAAGADNVFAGNDAYWPHFGPRLPRQCLADALDDAIERRDEHDADERRGQHPRTGADADGAERARARALREDERQNAEDSAFRMIYCNPNQQHHKGDRQ